MQYPSCKSTVASTFRVRLVIKGSVGGGVGGTRDLRQNVLYDKSN